MSGLKLLDNILFEKMNKDYINLQVMRKAKGLNSLGTAADQEKFMMKKISTVHPGKRIFVFIVGVIFSIVGALVTKEGGMAIWFGIGMIVFGVYFCVVALFGWRKRIKEITSALDAVWFTNLFDGIF